MEQVGNILNNHHINVNNVSKKIINNDINVKSSKGKYALDKVKFIPNTEESQLAEEIATTLQDINNYACFLKIINSIGCSRATTLFKSVLSDIEEKHETRTPVRNPAAYFVWKYKKGLY